MNYFKTFIYIISLVLIFSVKLSFAEEINYPTKYTNIKFSQKELIGSLEKAVAPSKSNYLINSIISGSSENEGNSNNLKNHIDSLFERVQLILDMPAPKFKINIILYNTQEQLSQTYQNFAAVKDDKIYAFYWHETKTIYLQKNRLAIGVIAHEIGHSIIDHFFIIRPPTKVSELLCQYVDKVITREF